ncbi:MAG: hypothetical protein MHM6MM_007092 [Cercozoa sp. M6MM]
MPGASKRRHKPSDGRVRAERVDKKVPHQPGVVVVPRSVCVCVQIPSGTVLPNGRIVYHGEAFERETDAYRIGQRQKMIDLGKNTVGYENYKRVVPLRRRQVRRQFGDHPVTPIPECSMSKRRWSGFVSAWRRALHQYDDASAPLRRPKQQPKKQQSGSTSASVDSRSNDVSRDTATVEPRSTERDSWTAVADVVFDSRDRFMRIQDLASVHPSMQAALNDPDLSELLRQASD